MAAYTYLVEFIPTGHFYYGVRYAGDVGDIFVNYFTSSDTVKGLIKQYGLHCFRAQVRRVFDDPKKALDWELRVLQKIVGHPLCMNRAVSRGVYAPDVVEQVKSTRLAKINSDGLNSYKVAGRKLASYLNSINPETGKTYAEIRGDRLKDTLQVVGDDGLTIAQRRALQICGDNNPSKLSVNKDKISSGLVAWNKARGGNPNKGKTGIHNEETRAKMRLAKLGDANSTTNTVWVTNGEDQLRVPKDQIPAGYVLGRMGFERTFVEKTCPHCNKTGKGGNMTRYHFNNCKENNVI